jgi:hypothetical protein
MGSSATKYMVRWEEWRDGVRSSETIILNPRDEVDLNISYTGNRRFNIVVYQNGQLEVGCSSKYPSHTHKCWIKPEEHISETAFWIVKVPLDVDFDNVKVEITIMRH